EDMRQIEPWVLHEKLIPNQRSQFFEGKGRAVLLQDRVAWIRNMFDMAMDQYPRHEPVRKKVKVLREEIEKGLQGVDLKTTQKRLGAVAQAMEQLMKSELSGAVYEDLIHLKSLHSRYQNYAQWLKQNTAR